MESLTVIPFIKNRDARVHELICMLVLRAQHKTADNSTKRPHTAQQESHKQHNKGSHR